LGRPYPGRPHDSTASRPPPRTGRAAPAGFRGTDAAATAATRTRNDRTAYPGHAPACRKPSGPPRRQRSRRRPGRPSRRRRTRHALAGR